MILSSTLYRDSETAESEETRKHQNAAYYERHLPNGISATEENADKADDETDNADANVKARGSIRRWPHPRNDEAGSIVWPLAWRDVHVVTWGA